MDVGREKKTEVKRGKGRIGGLGRKKTGVDIIETGRPQEARPPHRRHGLQGRYDSHCP